MHRCLVVDHDPRFRDLLVNFVGRFGIDARGAPDGASMRRLIETDTFDIVVLEIQLPDEDGLSLCGWLRRHSALPVIMCSARGDSQCRILGLEMGADDFLQKPFDPRELVARIHAILRRSGAPRRAAMVQGRSDFGAWTYDRATRSLESAGGAVMPLSSGEHRLLECFLSHPREVLSRPRLAEQLGAARSAGRHIDLSVSRLRRKLTDVSGNTRLIRTIRHEGYLFDSPPPA